MSVNPLLQRLENLVLQESERNCKNGDSILEKKSCIRRSSPNSVSIIDGPLPEFDICPTGTIAGGTPGRKTISRTHSRNSSRPHSRGHDEESTCRSRGKRSIQRLRRMQRIGADIRLGELEDEGEFDVRKISRELYKQEFHSFFDLLAPSQRDDFIHCRGDFACTLDSLRRRDQTSTFSKERYWKSRFYKIHKRIRHHLMSYGLESPFTEFLCDMETYLAVVFSLPEAEFVSSFKTISLPDQLFDACTTKPTCSLKSNERHVYFRFDNGLYRMLTHGLSYFHGLQSKTLKDSVDRSHQCPVLKISYTPRDIDSRQHIASSDGEQCLFRFGEHEMCSLVSVIVANCNVRDDSN